MTEREQFCNVLCNGPILQGDAVVVLCGEDADPRLAVATQLLVTGAAPTIVLSGGKHDPPRWHGAGALALVLLGRGVAHDRIRVEAESMNTRDQAVNVVALAGAEGWGRLLMVASPYHQYRAYLTFLQALREAGQAEAIHLIMIAAGQTPWLQPPAGMDDTRLDLLTTEFAKIDEYAVNGHVASYADGLAYLKFWEGK